MATPATETSCVEGPTGLNPVSSDSQPISNQSPNPRKLSFGVITVEILIRIIPILAQPDLFSMIRVSRAAFLITAPYLYTTFTIDPNSVISPVSATGVPINQCLPNSSLPSTTIDHLPNRLSYARHLTIVAHDRGMCANLLLPPMPHLISLRVQPRGQEDHLDLCHDSAKVMGSTPLPHINHTPCCPLVATLCPKRLILGDCTTGLTGSAKGLWPVPRSATPTQAFLPFLREIVILVGMVTGHEAEYRGPPSLLDHPPQSLEKVTFVSSCGDEAWEQLFRRNGDLHPLDVPSRASQVLMRQCAKFRCEIEIVEIQEAWPDGRIFEDEDTAVDHDRLRSELVAVLLSGVGHAASSAAQAAAAARRAKALTFVADCTFRKREPWYAAVEAASLVAGMEKVDRRAADRAE